MCRRPDSRRVTSRFSVMICISFRTVVYAWPRPRASATSRTVLGPRSHSTARISSSASVGFRRRMVMPAIIYDTFRSCQYEGLRMSCRRLALAPTPRPLRAGGRRRRFAVSLSRRAPSLAEPRCPTAGNLDLDPHPEGGREEIVGFCIDFHKKAVVITACVRGSPPFGHLERSPMRLAFRVLSVLAFLLLAPVAAHAQASITGVVKDASGAVLPGVTVEVASPALIEKVRTGTTDGTGQYRIINLVPGTYSVTFTLTGFGTTKREDIELTGSFTATVNADFKVSGFAETITVSGETPIVDTQSVRRQTTLSGELLTSVPTARS